MIFGNPVRGAIHPLGWKRPSANHEPKVTQYFGCTGFEREPALGSCAHFHRGLDISTSGCGADVVAPHAGTVRISQREPNGENLIVLNHGNGWVTSYGHLAARSVSKGQQVSRGQKIGDIGSTGNSTACHLHFGVKAEVEAGENPYRDSVGKLIDPWTHLEQNVRVRPDPEEGINIRTAAKLDAASRYAVVRGGRIVRLSDQADLGAVSTWRAWGGTVNGATYTVGATTSNDWRRIFLGGAYRFLAVPLAQLSAS